MDNSVNKWITLTFKGKSSSVFSHENTGYIGKKGEQLAVFWLKNQGYSILATNFTFKRYELDIVAHENISRILVRNLINFFKGREFSCEKLRYFLQNIKDEISTVYFFEVKTSVVDKLPENINPFNIIGPETRVDAKKRSFLSKAIKAYIKSFHVKHWKFYTLVVLIEKNFEKYRVYKIGSGLLDV